MITRKQAAGSLLRGELTKFGVLDLSLTTENVEQYITRSPTIAVCAEFLKLIKSPQLIEYAKTRGASFLISDEDGGKVSILSVRELLELLPVKEGK